MKKTLVALLLVGSSSALFAQNTPTTTPNNNSDIQVNPSASPTTDANTTVQPGANDMSTDVNSNVNTNSNITTDASDPSPVNPAKDVNTNSQNNTMTNNQDVRSSSVSAGNYNAYGTLATDVPTTVRYSFEKEHPNVTNAQWYQTPTGQLRVMYKDAANQDMDLYYYGSSAQSYMISLPLRQSLTSDDVVAKAKSMFGLAVYDVNRVKAANMEDVYHVRLLDNGQVKSVWINEQGSEVAAADVFRSTVVAENDVINEVNTAPQSNNNSNDTDNNSNSNSNPVMNNAMQSTENSANDKTKASDSSTENSTTAPEETTEVK